MDEKYVNFTSLLTFILITLILTLFDMAFLSFYLVTNEYIELINIYYNIARYINFGWNLSIQNAN